MERTQDSEHGLAHQLIQVGIDYSQSIGSAVGGSERVQFQRVRAPVILHAPLVRIGHLLVLRRARVHARARAAFGEEVPRDGLDLRGRRNQGREIHAFPPHAAHLGGHVDLATGTQT